MMGNDIQAFSEVMKGLAEIFDAGKPPSAIKIELYYRALQDCSIQEIKMAAGKLVKTRSYSSFPKPAEFLACLLDENQNEDRIKLAWIKVDEAVRKHGAWLNVQFDDPVIHSVINAMGGWDWICDRTNAQWEWDRKRFEELYPMMDKKQDHPKQLNGHCSGDPVMIGVISEHALQLMGENHSGKPEQM